MTRQLELLLDLFAGLDAKATFFTVGRLANELPSSTWHSIVGQHHLGCHGYDHQSVVRQGPKKFQEDLVRAKSALEQVSGHSIYSYRAPYFSSDGCDPWFGATLAEAGFKIDSSRRIHSVANGFSGLLNLPGSGNAVIEVPLPSYGLGLKRITVIGGTYFRLLPLMLIKWLLARAEQRGFLPLIYLHPYDLDPKAEPLSYPKGTPYWIPRAADQMRRTGRQSARDKLHALAEQYSLNPIESIFDEIAMEKLTCTS